MKNDKNAVNPVSEAHKLCLRRSKHTEECGKGAHVFLHQRINLVFGEASDPVAVHLSLHDAAGHLTQHPPEQVTQRPVCG